MPSKVPIHDFLLGEEQPLTLFSGPCVIESRDHTLKTAEQIKQIVDAFPVNLVFKASYDKANRSSIDSYRGPGIEEGLKILQEVKEQLGLPVVTDIHSPEDARMAGEVCDVLQIPAFLCRQTDLVVAAGETGRVVKIKKGQFMAPWDMKNVVDKVLSTGNDKIILTDRGTMFGYNNLISDMRAIPIMAGLGVPVCFDASHSVQLPGGQGNMSGGQREFIPLLARCAVAAGCHSLFVEAHPNPAEAKSDSASVLSLNDLSDLLQSVCAIHSALAGQASHQLATTT